MIVNISTRLVSICVGLLCLSNAQAIDVTSRWEIQNRSFLSEPATENNEQHNNYLSTAFEIEVYSSLNDNESNLLFKPFVRLDQYDSQRSHADVRELYWLQTYKDWQIKAGISKVFWGVTESQHLVDIINQTDLVESIDSEDKLGQPMLMLSIEKNWGLLDMFILPYFRERNFPSQEGRPQAPYNVAFEESVYESSDEQKNVDTAVRLLQFLGDLELGISYFKGTSREADFLIDPNSGSLIPFYRQMEQWGLDAQYTTAEWLWKLESINRKWSAQDYVASTAGFEYTFVGINESDVDLGVIIEYLYDDRGARSSNLFQNDIMAGFRLTLNNTQSTEALMGIIVDFDNQDVLASLEASTRLSQQWTAEIELRTFSSNTSSSPAFTLRKDDYLQLQFNYYF